MKRETVLPVLCVHCEVLSSIENVHIIYQLMRIVYSPQLLADAPFVDLLARSLQYVMDLVSAAMLHVLYPRD